MFCRGNAGERRSPTIFAGETPFPLTKTKRRGMSFPWTSSSITITQWRSQRRAGGPTAAPSPHLPPPHWTSECCLSENFDDVGKSDDRRRRIDPEQLTHSCYCILQITRRPLGVNSGYWFLTCRHRAQRRQSVRLKKYKTFRSKLMQLCTAALGL